MRVATDIGGTFTDYVILENGELQVFKLLTTLDPSQGILENLVNKNISEFSHGTTVAVNAILEHKGAKVVFFTTKGFRDLIHIGRQARTNVYSFICEKPQIPLEYIVEVEERIDKDGSIIKAVSEKGLLNAADKYSGQVDAAVIGFINSYANPKNEIIAENVLTSHFPLVLSSHNIRREIREYDRFATAVIEGYCAPVVKKYIENLKPLNHDFFIMQSNGGRAEIEHLRAVNMIMSGPAGGVAATEALCKQLNIENAIAYDMGGTSVDVSAIINGSPRYTDILYINDIPIRTLAIDIESIGAGGGSIAWVDDGGALKVGPISAGSDPGPACYNQGGKRFTVTDANLILGVLGERISGITLNKTRSKTAAEVLCSALDLEPIILSQGVLNIVNNNMVTAIKRISIGRGYDPREFTLVAFGGAGPMHACSIAESIGITKIIIPPNAGAFSALGIMAAPIRFDYIRTILSPLEGALDVIPDSLAEFRADLVQKLGVTSPDIISYISVDMRYKGQGHEINVPFNDNLTEAFQSRHQALFGFYMPDNPIEIVNLKLVAELPAPELALKKCTKNAPRVIGTRFVYPYDDVPIFNRDFHGSEIDGPCVIEDNTTTVYVTKNWKAKLDLNDILHLEREK